MNGKSTGDNSANAIDFELLRITRGRMEEILGALWHDVLYVDGIDPIDRQALKRHVKKLIDLVDELGRVLDSPDDEIDKAEAGSLSGLIVARFRQFLRHPAVAETAIATTLLAGGVQVAESQTVNVAVNYVIDQAQAATGETVSGAVIEQAVDDLSVAADDPVGPALGQPRSGVEAESLLNDLVLDSPTVRSGEQEQVRDRPVVSLPDKTPGKPKKVRLLRSGTGEHYMDIQYKNSAGFETYWTSYQLGEFAAKNRFVGRVMAHWVEIDQPPTEVSDLSIVEERVY